MKFARRGLYVVGYTRQKQGIKDQATESSQSRSAFVNCISSLLT